MRKFLETERTLTTKRKITCDFIKDSDKYVKVYDDKTEYEGNKAVSHSHRIYL